MDIKQSEAAFAEARQYIPGGVNSPVRAFNAVGGAPRFMKNGRRSRIVDIDGNEYIDFCMSWGSLILGHAPRPVTKAVKWAVEQGTSFGCPTELETRLARLVVEAVPSIEKVRFVNSGTEAVMSAVRLARGFTGRDKIIKFDGCYHGHADFLLVKAGSGVSGLSGSSSSGIPQEIVQHTISIPFNDMKAFVKTIHRYANQTACVLIEPVPANMGLILPGEDFLGELRRITRENDILLVFDEVITGFRIGLGGAQEYFDIMPDLTCLGKIIGGGFPVGAFGGRAEIMDMLAPEGNVYQAGTLSGNPVAMTAGIETLTYLKHSSVYAELNEKGRFLEDEFSRRNSKGIRFRNLGSMFCFFVKGPDRIKNFNDVRKCGTDAFALFYNGLLNKGIYLSPSQFETNFISHVHSQEDLTKMVEAVRIIMNCDT